MPPETVIHQDFAGRTALVTGASRGLGRAVAARLLERGAMVAINVRDRTRAEATARELGGATVAVPGDLEDEGVAESLVERTLSLTGRNPQAVTELERALEINSINPPGLFMFAQALLRAGQRDSAKAVADRLVRSFPAWRTAAGVLYGMLGERTVAEQTIRELSTADSVVAGRYTTMAMVALSIRDSARALDALERATEAREPWPTWGAVSDHHFDPLSGSARYSALLRRVGLDERIFNPGYGGLR